MKNKNVVKNMSAPPKEISSQNVRVMATRGSEPAGSPEEVESSQKIDQKASSGSPSTPCSDSSLIGREEAEAIWEKVMESLVELIQTSPAEKVYPVDPQITGQHISKLVESLLDEFLVIRSQEIPIKFHLLGCERCVPLLVLAWSILNRLESSVQIIDRITRKSASGEEGSEKVDLTQVVGLLNHIISLPNVKVMAHPLARANVDRGVEVKIR